jgi:hypothetical protein
MSSWMVRLGTVLLAWWLGLAGALAQSTNKVTVVDLLVVYTPAARLGAGGNQAIQSSIQTAVMEANLVFQNSRVNARFRLVRSAEVDCEESGSVSNDLARLRDPKDGFMDEVHTLRDQYAADLVCLVTETGLDWWFYGLQGPSAANAFSVIRRAYLTGGYYFPVALSFNFGCQLERPYADSVGAFPYAYGYSFLGEWGVVYSTVEAFSGPRLPFFSNPGILFQGTPAGVLPGQPYPADNARVLNQTAPVVAAFRGEVVGTFAPSIRLLAPTNGASALFGEPLLCEAEAADADGQVARVEFFADGWRIGSASNSPFRVVSTSLSIGGHALRAVVTDDQGAQAVSEPVTVVVRPANDDFAHRQTMEGERTAVMTSNEFASIEPDEPPHAVPPGYASVWWDWTAPVSGYAIISVQAELAPDLCNRRILEVYTGDALTNLVRVASTYDDSGAPIVGFPAAAGTSYAIVVDSGGEHGWWACSTGPFTLRLSLSAFRISTPLEGSQFTMPADIPISVVSAASDGEIVRTDFYADAGLLGTVLHAPFSLVWSNASLGPHQLQVVAENAEGETLRTAPIRVNVRPQNDGFGNRIELSGVSASLPGSNLGGTLESGEEMFGGGHTVWWSWTAPFNGSLSLFTATGEFFPGVRAYTGEAVTNLTLVGGVDYANIWPTVFPVLAGHTYQIAVDDHEGGPGAFALDLQFQPSPANDYFADRTVLVGDDVTVNGTLVAATSDPAVPVDGSALWYSWVAPARGSLFVSLDGSPCSPGAGIYTGGSPTNLVSLDYLHTPVGRSSVTVDVEPGVEYFIAVGPTWNNPAGEFLLRLGFAPVGGNDDFADRMVLVGLNATSRVSNAGATVEPGEPIHAGNSDGRSLWWTWTAPLDGRVTFSTAGSLTWPTLAIYRGDTLSNLIEVAASWQQQYPELAFEALAGQVYQAAVDARWGGGEGIVQLTITETLPPPPPLNDDFANRILVDGPEFVLAGDNTMATTEPGEPFLRGHSMWWTWTAPASGRLNLTRVDAADFYSLLVVYTGSSLTNLSAVASVSAPQQESRFDVTAGTVYQFMFGNSRDQGGWANYWGLLSTVRLTAPTNGARFLNPGPIPLEVSLTELDAGTSWVVFYQNGIQMGSTAEPPYRFLWTNVAGGTYSLEALAVSVDGKWRWSPPVSIRVGPPNDDFVCRIRLSGEYVELSADTRGATLEPGETKYDASVGGATAWWSWTAPRSGLAYFTALWSTYVAAVAIYTGDSVTDLVEVPNALSPRGTRRTRIVPVEAGGTYHVAVDGYVSPYYPPDGSLFLRLFASPSNDNFIARAPLSGTNVAWFGWTYLASLEAGEPNPLGWVQAAGTVWWSWTAPRAGEVTLTLTNGFTLRGTYLSVYTGSALASLSRVADNHLPGGTLGTRVKFRAEEGITYQLSFGNDEAHDQSALDIGVEFYAGLEFSPAPANDLFAHRTAIEGPFALGTGSTVSASSETAEPGHGGAPAARSIWWTWTAPANGRVGVTLDGGAGVGLRRVAVYTGDALTNLVAVPTNNPTMIPQAISGFYDTEALSFDALAGTTYQIAVDTSSETNASFILQVNLGRAELAAPVNGTEAFTPTNLLFNAGVAQYAPAVTQVVFQVVEDLSGQRWTGLMTNEPFSIVWSNASPGNFSVVAVATDANGHASVAAPARFQVRVGNDDFSDRIALHGLSAALRGYTDGATMELGEPHGSSPGGRTVWWSWTAPASGPVIVNRRSSANVPPTVSVYLGDELTNLTLVASSPVLEWPPDHAIEFPGFRTEDTFVFEAQAGLTYQVVVEDFAGEGGEVVVQLQVPRAHLTSPSDQSNFAAPTNLLLQAVVIDAEGVVQRVDFFAGTNWLASVTNRPFEFLWENVPVGDHALTVRAKEEFGSETVCWPVNIRVRLANDDFVNRLVLAGTDLIVSADNSEATSEPGEVQIGGWPAYQPWWGCIGCPSSSFDAGKTLWWTWTAPADGMLTIEAPGGDSRPLVSVLAGDAITNLVRLAHNGFCTCGWCIGCIKGTREQLRLPVTNGQICHISMDVHDLSLAGEHEFQLRFQPPPANDDFENRQVLTGTSFRVPVANWAASSEVGEPNPVGNTTVRSVWYAWTAPQSGRVTLASIGPPSAPETAPSSMDVIIIIIDPCGSTWEDSPLPPPLTPLFGVYRGDSVSNLVLLVAGTTATFEATGGVTYAFAVDGPGGTMGEAWMQLRLDPRPTNDGFARRIVLQGAAPVLSGHNIGATQERWEPLLDSSSEGRSVWWTWIAPASGTVRIGDAWSFYLGVFVGASVSELLPVTRGSGAVEFYAHAGTTYQIAVADSYGSEGTFDLAFSGLPAPPGTTSGGSIPLADGRFDLRIGGVTGQSFVVQASTNLLNWDTLAIDTLLGASTAFLDEDAALFPHRFYRVLPLEAVLAPAGLRLGVAPSTASGGFTVRISGPAGQPFTLRVSSDLIHWEEINRGWIIGDSVDLLDDGAAGLPARFYQVVPLP